MDDGGTELVADASLGDRTVERVVAGPSTKAFHLGALAVLGTPPGTVAGDLPSVMSWFLGRWRTSRGGDRPPLVWLDDAQELDGLSAAVLRQAVTAGIIQLVATHRTPDELPTEIRALLTEGAISEVDVPPLSPDETGQLATMVAGRELTDVELDEIAALSDGYPLFVVALSGVVDETVALSSMGSMDVLVGRRFRTLDPAVHTAELIAVAGPVSMELLADESEAVAQLRGRGLVERDANMRVRLTHPLYAVWLIEDLGPEVDWIYEQLIRRAKTAATGVVDDVTLADWHLRVGRPLTETFAASVTAEALARSDGPTALRFVVYVDGPERLLWEGQGQIPCGEIESGLALLDDARRTGPTELRVHAAEWTARFLGAMLRDYDRAHAVLDEVDHAGLAPELQRQVLIGRLWLATFGPSTGDLEIDRVHALTDSSLPGDAASYELAMCAASALEGTHGPLRAESFIRRMRELAPGGIGPRSLARGCSVEAWWHALRGEPNRGAALIMEHLPDRLAMGDTESSALLTGNLGL